MDGIEWKRAKWNFLAKLWFFINEIVGANISNVVIADHPEIAKHVQKRSLRKPVVIPYGADEILNAGAPPLELEPDRSFVSIARIEPENSILELVSAAAMLPASFKCVVLGTLQDTNLYHQAVRAAAGPNVVFPGAIYDKEQVAALRFHARAYLHGHQVGGTNPSLVEALGAGNAVLAHDNPFNRWTTGGSQSYFSGTEKCGQLMARLSTDDAWVANARRAARARHNAAFRREYVLDAYAEVIRRTAHGESCKSLSFRWKE
jgi:glycosyltransferase involved in cell wall biosynthesis